MMDQPIGQSNSEQELPPLPVGATIGSYLISRLTSSRPDENTYLGCRATRADMVYQIVEYHASAERSLAALAKLQLEHPALLAPGETLTAGGRVYVFTPAPQTAEPIEPLPADQALQQIIAIGEALAYLHSRGVAHLHVQPASIMLVDGHACLAGLEESQILRATGDDALLLFERDANFLALTLSALTVPGNGPLEQAINKIREQGISHSYQSVAQVIADCQRALTQVQGPARGATQTIVPALTILAGHATSVGRVRGNNEDALGNLLITAIDGHGQPCVVACFVVADGMGGEARGELASRLAVHHILEHALRRLALPALQPAEDEPDPNWTEESDTLERERQMREALLEGFRAANSEIRALAHAHGQAIGTTATTLLIFGRQALIAHAGDSRAYRLNSGVLTTLTEDHSYIQRLIQLGQIAPADGAGHPRRNALYRALGQQDALEIDVIACPLELGDRFLLCSDGLWDAVPETLLTRLLAQSEKSMAPTALAARLVTLADEAGGKDNSTALIIDIEG